MKRNLPMYSMIALMCCSPVSMPSRAAQTEKSREKQREARREERGAKTREAQTSVLGIRVGSLLDDVHRRLKSKGTIGGREAEGGGRKEACALKATEFSSIAYQTNGEGRVRWVTGFVRPGKEIPFSKLGDLAHANAKNDSFAVWNIETPEGSYRLVAKGPHGKASVVSLISLGEDVD